MARHRRRRRNQAPNPQGYNTPLEKLAKLFGLEPGMARGISRSIQKAVFAIVGFVKQLLEGLNQVFPGVVNMHTKNEQSPSPSPTAPAEAAAPAAQAGERRKAARFDSSDDFSNINLPNDIKSNLEQLIEQLRTFQSDCPGSQGACVGALENLRGILNAFNQGCADAGAVVPYQPPRNNSNMQIEVLNEEHQSRQQGASLPSQNLGL